MATTSILPSTPLLPLLSLLHLHLLFLLRSRFCSPIPVAVFPSIAALAGFCPATFCFVPCFAEPAEPSASAAASTAYYMSSLPNEAVYDKERSSIAWPKQLNAPLEAVDPEIADIIELEKARQWKVPYSSVFRPLLQILGPLCFDISPAALGLVASHVAAWPPPSPGFPMDLPIGSATLRVHLPPSPDTSPPPHSPAPDNLWD